MRQNGPSSASLNPPLLPFDDTAATPFFLPLRLLISVAENTAVTKASFRGFMCVFPPLSHRARRQMVGLHVGGHEGQIGKLHLASEKKG